MTATSSAVAAGLALAAIVAALALTSNAAAYCRATTCDAHAIEQCNAESPGCAPQTWESGCLGYVVDVDGAESQGIDAELARAAVREAFATWLRADCGGGERPSIEVYDLGATHCEQHEYQPEGRNANSWIFRDQSWPHSAHPDAYALTFTRFDPDGALLDADVEINAAGHVIGTDLQSVLTHEAGHVLGLAHSDVPGATMQPSYDPGAAASRELHADDVAAICAAYPPEAKRASCDPTPRGGVYRRCGPSEVTGHGCALVPNHGSSRPRLLLVLALLVVLARSRRGAR